MNHHDAQMLPISTAMNLHPFHRRQGTIVQRAEVEEALRDLGLESVRLPRGRLINAAAVERILAENGISVELVKHRTAALFRKGLSD